MQNSVGIGSRVGCGQHPNAKAKGLIALLFICFIHVDVDVDGPVRTYQAVRLTNPNDVGAQSATYRSLPTAGKRLAYAGERRAYAGERLAYAGQTLAYAGQTLA